MYVEMDWETDLAENEFVVSSYGVEECIFLCDDAHDHTQLELIQQIYLSKGLFNHQSLQRIPLKPDETDKVTKASHITEEGYFFVLLENQSHNY